MEISYEDFVKLMIKQGVTWELIEANHNAVKSHYKPAGLPRDCEPACGNGFICNKDLGECVPSVGAKIS